MTLEAREGRPPFFGFGSVASFELAHRSGLATGDLEVTGDFLGPPGRKDVVCPA